MFSQTGAMTKKVMNSESPMMIWLAGEPCNCSAERTKPSTIATRVKQVINSRIEGASDSSVMRKRILMPESTSGAPLFGPSEMESGPSVVVAALVWAWRENTSAKTSSRATTPIANREDLPPPLCRLAFSPTPWHPM